MYLIHISRDIALNLLPPGGMVAEIGVAKGEFSRVILDTCKPDRLHLVDPWLHQADEDYLRDVSNVPQTEADDRFELVSRAFAERIAAGQVTLHRTFSVEAAKRFDDATFDWVYIDARHTYDAVLEDLRAWAPKVKPDGMILGHDYCNHDMAKAQGFGVIEAVDRFVEESGYPMLMLTAEGWPTYILAKAPEGAMAQRAVALALAHIEIITEIRGPLPVGYELKVASFGDGKYKLVHSFGVGRDPA